MKKKYVGPLHETLRQRMQECGITSDEIAKRLCISSGTFSRKLNAAASWKIEEAYAVLDMLGVDYSELYLYFPPGGEDVEDVRRTSVEDYLRLTDSRIITNSALSAIKTLLEGIQ